MADTAANEDEALEAEANEMGQQAEKAADFAQTALDQIRRLQTRSKMLRKLIESELK